MLMVMIHMVDHQQTLLFYLVNGIVDKIFVVCFMANMEADLVQVDSILEKLDLEI